ncbi:MAG: hypothetical protein NC201_05725 [Prevotella sp.]|nr:hypothetical protein [Bacteroides sp.]MCM1366732.1 hypothetical protein [Prevotella sp.]MCM1437030.1 hypothetical protein [Prevotella sp.]
MDLENQSYGEEINTDADARREENSEQRSENPRLRDVSVWGVLIRLFVSPLNGWKRLKNSRLTPEKVASGMFYPLISVASLSVFADKFYSGERSLSLLLERAIGVFVSFFAGYYIVLILCKMILPGDAKQKIESRYGKMWLEYLISTLTIFYILYEILPVLEPILFFTPIMTLYLAIKGVRFLRLEDGGESATGWTAGLLSVAVPYGINYLFEVIVPTV